MSTLTSTGQPGPLSRALRHPALDRQVTRLGRWLNTHSVSLLRVSLGLVFLGFGALKFVPGLSPAEGLATATVERLTLGVVEGPVALVLTAVIETVIGLTLLTGRFLKVGLVVLAGALVGIMAPLVLLTDQLFEPGPTLAAQYVIKDIVLAAGGLVVAAHALGGRLRTDSHDRDRTRPEDPSSSVAGHVPAPRWVA